MKLSNKTDISGIFGESVVIRKVNGRIVVTNRPKRKRPAPTAKELAHRERISEAANYARSICETPAMRSLYATGVKKKNESPQSVAIGDYMNAPAVGLIKVVEQNSEIGNVVQVHATDDFQVIKVTVTITNEGGKIIEQGDAVPGDGRIHEWEYKSVVATSLKGMKIAAVAYDRPGNQGRAEIVF